MNEQLITGQMLPEQVFARRYDGFRFIHFDQLLVDAGSLFGLLGAALGGNGQVELYDQSGTVLSHYGDAGLNPGPGSAAELFSAADQSGVPYLQLVASAIVVVDKDRRFCLFADRGMDLIVIGAESAFLKALDDADRESRISITLDTFQQYLSQVGNARRAAELSLRLRENYPSGNSENHL